MAAKRPRKNKFVKAWLDEHLNDPWVREATRRGYRSRAAFKLLELAERDRLFRPGMSVVDLGAAPGSWTQVLREKLGPRARIVALDLLDMAPLPGVVRIRGDFRDDPVVAELEAALEGRKVDLVVSDLAPNLSGIESADQARAVHLGELAMEFTGRWLEPGGDLVVKAFQGAGFAEFQRELQRHFDKVYVRKPKASRDRSREVYLVAKGHKSAVSDRFDGGSGRSETAGAQESGSGRHEGLKLTSRRPRPDAGKDRAAAARKDRSIG